MLGLLALPYVTYVSNSRHPADHNAIDQLIVAASAPVQAAVVGAIDGVANTFGRYIALMAVRDDNARLKAEVVRLGQANVGLQERLQQLEHLHRLMRVREANPEVIMVHAQIIAASPSALFRSVRINRGRDDGLTLGAAVIGDDGVVGRVAALGRKSSDVMLLIDANSSADVLVQRTRARARVRGRGADNDFSLDAQYLSRVAEVEPGDLLVTGGLGRTFPKGLPVGRVTGVERRAFGLYQRAIIEPSVDFARLEHVMVVVSAVDVAADG